MIRARIGLLVSSALFVATPLRGDGPPLPKDSLDAADLSGESKLGLPDAIPGIENSPLATARLRLGRKLFFDPILSIDRTVACASCHEPEKGFASGEARPLGVQGRRCARNAPTRRASC